MIKNDRAVYDEEGAVICRSLVPLGPPSKTVRPRRYMWDSENNIIAAEATEEPAKP